MLDQNPSRSGGKFRCKICGDQQVTWDSKQKLIRHILKFDGGHWKAALTLGKDAFSSNSEYVKIIETLEKRNEVKKFLESKRAAQE